jgi:hypothetical protein
MVYSTMDILYTLEITITSHIPISGRKACLVVFIYRRTRITRILANIGYNHGTRSVFGVP